MDKNGINIEKFDGNVSDEFIVEGEDASKEFGEF